MEHVVPGRATPNPLSDWSEALRARAAAALPPTDGEIVLSDLHRPVEVLRDRWGVPHIYAHDLHDVYLAQGYVLASERLFQLDLALRVGSGRLAGMFGESALPLDRFIRTVGWNRAGRRLRAGWDDLSREMCDAYVSGVRAWIDRMPARPVEFEILDLDPHVPEGHAAQELIASASVFMSWSLSGNWDAELLRLEIAERLGWEAMATLFPDLPTDAPVVRGGKDGGRRGRRAILDLLREAPAVPPGQGSNAWVVAGRRSVTGKPLLANDPHLLAQLPSPWFEVHLIAPGIDVRGVALPFAPGVVVGHNDRLAWGITNLGGDTQDVYVERLDRDRTAALYDGSWEPLSIHREEIEVRGRGEPEVVDVRETRHGPILDAYLVGMADVAVVPFPHEDAYALRFVGFEEAAQPSTVHRLDTASNFDEFRAAAAEWSCPGCNFVYADVDGNIAYQACGSHPIRRRGDGTFPVPGWTDEFEWDGYVPFEELPWALNPDEGFIVTANNKPYDGSYPWMLGKDFIPPFRARRIAQLVAERPRHDAESFGRIQMDTLSLPAMECLPALLEVEPSDDRQKQALALLRDWDFDLGAGSAAAAVYEVWCCRIADEVLASRLGEELYVHYHARRQWTNHFQYQVLPGILAYPTGAWFGGEGRAARDTVLRRALDAALEELTSEMGEDPHSWSWGRLHRVRFAGRLAIVPDLGELFTGGEGPLGGDEQTVLQGAFEPGVSYRAVVVPSWRQIVDLGDLDRSVGTITLGQSGNPASPHFNDQFPLWSSGRHHPLPFTRRAVEAAAESTLRLVPRPAGRT